MSVHFEPLAPAVGAEVTGVDPCRPLDPEIVAEIEAAFAEYGVVLFREAPMSPEELMAFSRHFGPLPAACAARLPPPRRAGRGGDDQPACGRQFR